MNNNRILNAAALIFVIGISLWVLILAKSILIPLVVSIFFAYLLYPVVSRIERMGVNRVFAILIVIVLAIAVFGTATLFVILKISNVSIDLVELKQQIDQKANILQNFMEARFALDASTINSFIQKMVENLLTSWQTKAGNIFSATTTIIFQIGILPVFTFFLLFYRTKTAYFLFRLASRKNRRMVLRILRETSDVTTRYLAGVLTVVFILAVLNSLGLTIIGVPHALVLGILAALLNLIPYIGTFIGGLIPFLYVLFTYPDPLPTLIQIVIMFVVVQFIENNLLTPNIVGTNIKINPLAIILSLLLANLVWGIAGMLVVVPCLAILKIVMRNIDELKPFAFLISDRGMERYRLKFNWFKKIKNRIS